MNSFGKTMEYLTECKPPLKPVHIAIILLMINYPGLNFEGKDAASC
jgi:hypothetical protein